MTLHVGEEGDHGSSWVTRFPTWADPRGKMLIVGRPADELRTNHWAEIMFIERPASKKTRQRDHVRVVQFGPGELRINVNGDWRAIRFPHLIAPIPLRPAAAPMPGTQSDPADAHGQDGPDLA